MALDLEGGGGRLPGRPLTQRLAAEQHVCFIAHLDRWMQAEGIGLEGLSRSTIERYLAQRRAAGYVEYRSLKALQPLLANLAPLSLDPTGTGQRRWSIRWKPALNAFDMAFDGRLSTGRKPSRSTKLSYTES